jgi:Putative amidoligase enzyme
MNILELDSYNLADAVKFHNRLNPRLWGSDEHLQPKVQSRLQEIAEYFQEFLGVPDLDVKDITISGSNAAYSYTPHSDIDLHLVVAMPSDPVYQELFAAKKYEFNDTHNIRIGGADVELYVQPADQVHHSQGIYSIKNQTWVQVPQRKRAKIDDACVRDKVSDLDARIHKAIQSHNVNTINSLWQKIRSMRQSGLEQHGEFGCENITFKLLRNKGCIKALKTAMDQARDRELSLAELARPQQRVRYGFRNVDDEQVEEASLADMRDAFQTELRPGVDLSKQKVYRSRDEYQKAKDQQARQQEIAKELVRTKPRPWPAGVSESPDGVNPTTAMFLTEADPESIVDEFIQHTAERLGIKRMPEIFIHHDEDWSKQNHSFGMYVPERHELHVSLGNRHLLDILRTTAHELCHCAQHEQESLPDNAGVTGSAWENEAHAVAGIIMRDFADAHPDYFKMAPVRESASGYIPKNKREARDPRYSMALTVDIKPGQVGKEANKLALHTGRNGEPALLMKSANLQESLAAEFALFESQDLFEINMGSKNLRREAAKTGAIAGMEFEMIVPNVEGGSSDLDQEADYDYDQRCRSIQDAYDFFYDGDWNSRRSCDEMRDKMREDYIEWLDEKIASDWDSQGEEYIYQWVKENVDESEWNPEDKSDLERTEALEEYAANVHADPVSDQYQSAYEEFREENQESYDESDWLDDADLSRMSEIENAYSMSWPHWSDPQSGGEASIEDIAQEFENAIGRDVRASGNYHSGNVIRPSPTQIRYVVEPDGSLEPDDPNDQGLEFVSPPLPIDEILGDLNKVKRWAKEYGCYTNDSTGLHINISVPDYSRQNLDFVKLALLMGDKYVLDAFGRASNTYAKSALDIVKRHVRDNPEGAAQLLDKMKGNLDQLASKAIHSGITSKYTSINTKDGHIEFRSPGGDWLDENFDKIENTLLRFTVAMSAALNPEMYRQEYLTKLYKMLTENNKDDDTIKYFSDYVAGKIPKAALRSFVKQAQLQRNIKRGKTDGQKMWWKVYKDGRDTGRYGSTVEVVATSEKEAIEKAAKEWGEPLLVNTLARMDAEVLRPYEDKPGSGTYELYNKQTGLAVPDTEFSARNEADQATRLQDYINHGQHGMNAQDASYAFGVRPVADSGDTDQGPSANSLRPTGPGPWEIYNRATGNSAANLSVDGRPITDRAQAQRMAMGSIAAGQHDNYGVRTRGTLSGANIGTQTDMENRLGMPSQSEDANYAVVDRQTLDPVFRFRAADRTQANRIYGYWLAAAGLPQTTEDYGFQEIRSNRSNSNWRIVYSATGETLNTVNGASRDQAVAVLQDTARRNGVRADMLSLQPAPALDDIPEVPVDVAQNFPQDRTDGRNVDYSFRDLFGTTDQTSSAPAGNSFSGQWRVVDGAGRELYVFRGVGNNQADANRIAATWARENNYSGALDVVPVMI